VFTAIDWAGYTLGFAMHFLVTHLVYIYCIFALNFLDEFTVQHSIFAQQMRNLFCKKLAACLSMKRSPSSSSDPRFTSIMYRSVDKVFAASSSEVAELDSVKRQEIRDLLGTRICDLLDARVGNEEQRNEADKPHNDKDDKEDEMKNDWMLAAAVLDRIFAITVGIIYVVGSVLLFFILFFNYYTSVRT